MVDFRGGEGSCPAPLLLETAGQKMTLTKQNSLGVISNKDAGKRIPCGVCGNPLMVDDVNLIRGIPACGLPKQCMYKAYYGKNEKECVVCNDVNDEQSAGELVETSGGWAHMQCRIDQDAQDEENESHKDEFQADRADIAYNPSEGYRN